MTGGQVWHYPSFHPGIHGQGLSADIVAAVQRQTAWEAVMRVRCSKGVHVAQHFGHFFIRSTDLLALPACDAHKVPLHIAIYLIFITLILVAGIFRSVRDSV